MKRLLAASLALALAGCATPAPKAPHFRREYLIGGARKIPYVKYCMYVQHQQLPPSY